MVFSLPQKLHLVYKCSIRFHNHNFITTLCACCFPIPPARCTEPPVTGDCRNSYTRWYYNPIQRECTPFNYGGCRGNENRFTTRDDCMAMCKGVTGGRGPAAFGAQCGSFCYGGLVWRRQQKFLFLCLIEWAPMVRTAKFSDSLTNCCG